MKILHLSMANFGPYKGVQSVDFPTDPAHRIMLVFGDNMRGKTSFLNAIRWVLYGRALDRLSREIELLKLINREAQDEGEYSLSVNLKFEADGAEYELARSIEPYDVISRPKNNSHFRPEVLLRRNGAIVSGDEIEGYINTFIPEQVSRFYLFDGELLDEYESLLREDSTQGQLIKKSIEQILGVPALVNARRDLQVLLKKAQALQAKESKHVSALASFSTQSLQYQEQISAHERDIEFERGKLATLNERIDRISTELADAEPIQALHHDLTSKRAEKDQIETRLQELDKELHEVLKGAWRDLLQPLLEQKREDLANQIERNRSQVMRQGALEDRILRLSSLLSEARCPMCERAIDDVVKARIGGEIGTLSAELREVQFAATSVTEISHDLSNLSKISGTGAAVRARQIERSKEKSSIRITSLETELEELEDLLRNHSVASIAQLQKEKDGLLKIKGKLEKNIEEISTEIETKTNKVKQLARLMYKSPEARNQRSSREVEIYTGLEQVLSRGIDILRDRLRARVADEATNAFKQLTTEKTYSGLRINNNYGLTILDRNHVDVPVRSAGAEQIVAMSLLSALNRTVNRPGPIVVDTPFGRLDPQHRDNILRFVPNMGEQIVFLVHEGEINRESGLPVIAQHVGATYEIRRITSSHSEIVRA